MKKITLKLEKDNYLISVITCPFDSNNRFKFQKKINNFLFELDFSSPENYHARAYLYNLRFTGRVNSFNNWRIFDIESFETILLNKNNTLYVLDKKSIIDIDEELAEKQEIKADNIKESSFLRQLQDKIINQYSKKYEEIINKVEFDSQLYEYLEEMYHYEYDEDYDIIGLSEVESEKDIILDCNNFFNNFIKSEKDQKNISKIITYKKVIKYIPELKESDIKDIYYEWESNNLDNFILLDIFYTRKGILIDVANELKEIYMKYKKKKFEDNFIVYLKDNFDLGNYDDGTINLLSKEILYNFKEKEVPEADEIFEISSKYIKYLNDFNKKYIFMVNSLGNTELVLTINEEKIDKYSLYENENISLTDEELDDYNNIYLPVKNKYMLYCCRKNSNKPKPTIEKFNTFINYVLNIFNKLIEHNYLIKEDDEIRVNYDVDTDIIIKAIKEIVTS